MQPPATDLTRYAWLSIAAALATILLKGAAWWITGSVGLLSDALESFVNLAAALLALWALQVSAQPADEGHPYGHGKADYFSSVIEGALIVLAAVGIVWTAVPRLLAPQPIEALGAGLLLSVLASAVNLGVALVLLRVARSHRSIVLEADAHHLLSDVWTSAGVIVGVAAAALTGWLILDPLIAIAVAVNILRVGWQLVRRSVDGLMDAALPAEDLAVVTRILEAGRARGAEWHALRTRQAGRTRFVSVHILVPGAWSVSAGHELLEELEREIHAALPGSVVFTHLEPIEAPAAYDDATPLN
ncbi:MAG: cation transporter [Betaproteobacteria bacterium]|nr:cation transporter [Betaproteobacteria bacterium]